MRYDGTTHRRIVSLSISLNVLRQYLQMALNNASQNDIRYLYERWSARVGTCVMQVWYTVYLYWVQFTKIHLLFWSLCTYWSAHLLSLLLIGLILCKLKSIFPIFVRCENRFHAGNIFIYLNSNCRNCFVMVNPLIHKYINHAKITFGFFSEIFKLEINNLQVRVVRIWILN